MALSGGLAACGGGGSTTMTPEPEPIMCPDGQEPNAANDGCVDTAETMEMKALTAAQSAAQKAATDAGTAAGAAEMAANAQTANKAHDEASYALAQNAAERARTASDAAAAANTAAQAATTSAAAEAQRDIAQRHKQTAETERANAMKYAGMVQTAKTNADAAAIAAAEEAATTKSASTKLMAMTTEAGRAADATDEGLGGLANDADAAVAYMLAISRDRDGTEVKVTDPALPNRADPKFVDQMAGLDAGRFMLVRTKDADADGNVEEEVVIVGTDIKVPMARPFGRVHTLNARDLDANVDADGDSVNDDDFTAIFVGADAATEPTPPVLELVKSAAFPLTGDGLLRFDFDVSTTNADEADEVAGYYQGARGTYRCALDSAQCTVTIGPDPDDSTKRIIIAMSTGWIFTPNAGVTIDVADANYLHYGVWLKKTTDEDGVLTYNEVETFAGATGLAASESVAAVTGTASYDGDAVGVYVHHMLSQGGGKIESSTSGHFKADASLTATFGQVPVSATDTTGTIAPNLLNTVTGSIDNFILSGGEQNDWSVNLARGAITTGSGTAAGMAEGGGVSGSYSATFHGSVTAAADDTVPKPSAVVGEFNANMSNGSVAGAFGANMQ